MTQFLTHLMDLPSFQHIQLVRLHQLFLKRQKNVSVALQRSLNDPQPGRIVLSLPLSSRGLDVLNNLEPGEDGVALELKGPSGPILVKVGQKIVPVQVAPAISR